ncbi:MAG: MFS transporter [Burkholderiaceae bacterium]|nr:MFS transporter [Burkholderiaceae bacterium]
MSAGSVRDFRQSLPWVIATLIAVHACMAVTRVTASLWVLHHGYGEWTVGVLLSLFAVAPIALSLWAGQVADRHGFHLPVGLGVCMSLVGAVIALLGSGLAPIAFSCLLSGGGLCMSAVAIQREAGHLAEDAAALKRVFSWVALGPALSNSIAPVVTGVLIDHLGFHAAFVFAAVLPLLAWRLALKVPRVGGQSLPSAAAPVKAKPAWDLLRQAPLRNLLLVNVVLSACWDSHSFVVPVVGHAKGLSASSIGLVLGSFAVAATVVRLAIVRWAHHLDELQALRGAMVLAAAMLLVYAWLPGTAGLMAGSAVLGLALGSVQPMILATLHQVTPSDRHGQALGLRMLMVNAATASMPMGFGVLASATVAAAPMWLMASLLMLAQWPAAHVARQRGLEPT